MKTISVFWHNKDAPVEFNQSIPSQERLKFRCYFRCYLMLKTGRDWEPAIPILYIESESLERYEENFIKHEINKKEGYNKWSWRVISLLSSYNDSGTVSIGPLLWVRGKVEKHLNIKTVEEV